jgi:hypothetical protein
MLTLGCTHTPQPTTNRKLSCFSPSFAHLRHVRLSLTSAQVPVSIAHLRLTASRSPSAALPRDTATPHIERPGRKFDSSGKGTIEERKDGGLACASPDFRGQYVFPPSSLQFPSFVGNIEGGLQVVKGGVLMVLGQAIGPLTMNRSRMGRRTRRRSWSLTREMVRIYFSRTQGRGTDAGIV